MMSREELLDLDIVPRVKSARDLIKSEMDILQRKEKRFDREDIKEIFTEPEHSNLRNAVLADVLDAVPLIGDAANIIRVVKIREDLGLFEKGQDRREERFKQALQAGNFNDIKEAVKDSINDARDEIREFQKKKGGLQAVDAGAGLVPGLGGVADIITPTNTINYISEKRE
ncbi:hypothetical protein KAR91_61680 [Candidatus Pacearchaeota archaeon]|nr:hypothetical protein [Candidatus Pacearchaeota archaeon]